MSEKEILKRFWYNIAGGIVVLIIAGVSSSFYVASATADRSIRNEASVKELMEIKADKTDNYGVQQMLLQGQLENKEQIKLQSIKLDGQFQFILERLDNVNQNLINANKGK